MSRILTLFLGSVALATCSSGCAVAQTCNDGCSDDRVHSQSFWYDYYRNKSWPMPFRAADSRAVLSYFDVQRSNGWKLHNTLGAAMFNDATCELNDAGMAHVRWIVTQAPQDRRVVFVLEGDNQETSAKRVEATQIAISRYVPTGALPTIYLTDKDAPGSSGEYQTQINRAINASIPAPRLATGGNTGTP